MSCSFVSLMRNTKLNINKKLISFLFLLVLGGIIFNSTFFLHSHRTACGKLIVHAHPFNKHAESEDASSQHKHNKIDLQVISSLDYFFSCNISYNIKSNFIYKEEILNKPIFSLNSRHQLLTLGRDPPFLL